MFVFKDVEISHHSVRLDGCSNLKDYVAGRTKNNRLIFTHTSRRYNLLAYSFARKGLEEHKSYLLHIPYLRLGGCLLYCLLMLFSLWLICFLKNLTYFHKIHIYKSNKFFKAKLSKI